MERRKFIRVSVPLCVNFKIGDEKEEFRGVTRDISYGGVRLVMDDFKENLSPKPPIYSLEILFPKQTFRFQAQLVWVKQNTDKYEAGFYFLDLPQGFKEVICNYLPF